MCAAVAVAGCSSGDNGSADPVSSASATASAAATPTSNTAWNPCDISDADIASAGLNPSTKRVGSAGVKFPGWDICTWRSDSWYQMNILATDAHTYDEVVHNTTLFHDPRPVTVGARPATALLHNDDEHACTIAFDMPTGPVQFDLTPKLSSRQFGDACAEATRIAGVLDKNLPQ